MKRPIVFFDLETTGVSTATDRIVEICLLKVNPDGTEEVKTRRVNPTIPIDAGATEVHGISDEDVKDCPTFSQLAKGVAEWLKGCDLGGYNSNRFDLPMLVEEFLRCDVQFPEPDVNVIDVFKIFTINNPRTLTAAYKKYCDKDLEDAHSAEADTIATKEVFMQQMKEHDLPESMEELDAYCKDGKTHVDYAGKLALNDDGDVVFTFGKHKGKRVADEKSYAQWMLKGDFTMNTKNELRKLI